MVKKKAKKKQQTALVQTSGAAKRWQIEEAYRQMELAYITDEQLRTVEYWWQQLAANVVGLRAAMERCRKARWEQRREKFRRGVLQGALQKAKYQAIRTLSAELQKVQALRDQTYEMVMAKIGPDGRRIIKVQPKSYEGMVRAFVVVDARVESLRDALLSMVEPELQRSADKAGSDAEEVFAKDDMRAVVRMLLERKRVKQGIGADDDDNDNDED
jgi:hypothetical protein